MAKDGEDNTDCSLSQEVEKVGLNISKCPHRDVTPLN